MPASIDVLRQVSNACGSGRVSPSRHHALIFMRSRCLSAATRGDTDVKLMTRLITLALMFCAFPFVVQAANADDFSLQIQMTRGERSRDSGAATTTISIARDTITYKLTYSGMHRGKSPADKVFRLEAADRKHLIELIKAGNLLVSETIERPYGKMGASFYFGLSVDSNIDGKKGQVVMRGPRNSLDLKDTPIYKNAVALIEAVYEIITRTDPKLVYEPLIH